MKTLFPLLLLVFLVGCGPAPESTSSPLAASCKPLLSYWAIDAQQGLSLTDAKLNDTMPTWGYVVSGGERLGCWFKVTMQGDERQGWVAVALDSRETKPACGNLNGTYDYVKSCATATLCPQDGRACFEAK